MSDRLTEELAQMDRHLGLEPEAPEEETPPAEEQPRDEQGRFAAKDPEGPREDDLRESFDEIESGQDRGTQARAAAGQDERLQGYLAKYGGDVDKALAAAVEAQELIGRQGSELGELRKTLDKLNATLDREPAPESLRIDQPGVLDSFDELVEQNPAAAVKIALERDPTGVLYNRALEGWYELNPRQASAFERQVELAQLRSELTEQLSQETAPLLEQASKQGLAEAWNEGRQMYADLDDFAEQIVAAAKENPELAEGLVSRDAELRGRSLRSLYFMAKGMQTATTEAATAEATAAAQQAARAAKQDGTVATQTTTVQAETVDENEALVQELYGSYLDRYQTPEA